MNAKYEIFRKLLTVDELYELYCQIGETVLSHLDVKNTNRDEESTDNSIQLLIETSLIAYDSESRTHSKKMNIVDKSLFIKELYIRLLDVYSEAFAFIDREEIRYDEAETKFYIKRNYVKLGLSGLLMILNGMGVIELKNNNIYFADRDLLRIIGDRFQNQKKMTSLSELLKQLHIQEELGNDAELAAIEYEKRLLSCNNILREPERVSLYDVKAGYDIASYMTPNSYVPDKFIEVKSCANEQFHFYFSKNEIDTAKRKKNHYYLYLFNRKSNKFTIIKDPFKVLFECGEMWTWAIEPQVYQIHSLGKVENEILNLDAAKNEL